jgi:hypothetical protein
MRPPNASLFRSLSLTLSFVLSFALCSAYAAPSAADSQLEHAEQIENLGESPSQRPGEQARNPVGAPIDSVDAGNEDEGRVDPRLYELGDAIDQSLGERVGALLDELATTALDRQVRKIAKRRTRSVTLARSEGGMTPCADWRNAEIHCMVVTARSQVPASGDFSTARP